MYKCPDCKRKFEEPVYEEIDMEVYCGVSSMFDGPHHYATFASCPYCGEAIDIEEDAWDEAFEEDEDDEE